MTDTPADPAARLADRLDAAAPVDLAAHRARKGKPKAGKGGKAPTADAFSEPGETGSQGTTDAAIERLNGRHAVIRLGGKTLVMTENPGADVERRVEYEDKTAFLQWYENQTVWTGRAYQPVAKVWFGSPLRRQFHGVVFEPGGPPEIPSGADRLYNLWRGFEVAPREGDCSKLIHHLHHVICGGRSEDFAWVLQWFAHLIQRPCERIGTALVLRGGQGAGKTWVGRAIGQLIAAHYLLVSNPAHIVGQFNAHMQRLLLLQADEGFWAGDKVAEGTLKSLVTSDVLTIEPKNVNAYQVPNRVRLMITSNERWVVPAGFDERRFAVFDVGAEAKQDHGYFAALDEEWRTGGKEAFLHLLMNEPLTVNLRRIPKTKALLEQKINSSDPVVSWWYTCLRDGCVKPGSDWPADLASEELYAQWHAVASKAGVRRPGDKESMFIRLKQVAPGLERVKRSVSGLRVPYYRFPPLAEARRELETVMNQPIEWGDAEDGS